MKTIMFEGLKYLIPDDSTHMARDIDGRVEAYISKPEVNLSGNFWIGADSIRVYPIRKVTKDWKNSLIEV